MRLGGLGERQDGSNRRSNPTGRDQPTTSWSAAQPPRGACRTTGEVEREERVVEAGPVEHVLDGLGAERERRAARPTVDDEAAERR